MTNVDRAFIPSAEHSGDVVKRYNNGATLLSEENVSQKESGRVPPPVHPLLVQAKPDPFLSGPMKKALAYIALSAAGLIFLLPGEATGPVLGILFAGVAVFVAGRAVANKCAPYRSASAMQARAEATRWRQLQLEVAERLFDYTPEQFEAAVARAFARRVGYEARQTPFQKDGGWDVELLRDGKRTLVECKRYAATQTVGRPLMQKLHSAMVTERAAGAIMVTTGRISEPALAFAEQQGIVTFDGGQTTQLFRESFPLKEHPDIVWAICPRCAEQVLVDTRDDVATVRCSQTHVVPYPVPAVKNQRWKTNRRAVLRDRARNVDTAAFFARRSEREREAAADAEAKVERVRAAIAFDWRWVGLRLNEDFASRDDAERTAATANAVLKNARRREASIAMLEAKAQEARAYCERQEAERATLAAMRGS